MAEESVFRTLSQARLDMEDGDSRASLGDRAYDLVRQAILRGEIPAGTVLAEGELARSLGISRTPVRQVLHLLLQEELVEVGPRRQLIVRGLPLERRLETFLLREPLERVAVTRACEVMPIEAVDELRTLLRRQQRAVDADRAEEFLELDEGFHLAIAEGARLPLLVKFLTQLRAFVRLAGVSAVSHPGRMSAVIAEHEAIADAIEARDQDRAAAEMSAHLSATAAVLDDALVAGSECS